MIGSMVNAHDSLWLMLAALPAILSIGGGTTIVTLAQQVNQSPKFADITDFFDGIKDDRTKVTWAHAVNSRDKLKTALEDKTMMLEADVSVGKTSTSAASEPIMAHPPANTSDLSLKEFLSEVNKAVASGKMKGVKLDFKSNDVYNMSVPVLKELIPQKPFPMWLNADIVSGPVSGEAAPVTADVFLNVSKDSFRTAGLSLGWTTSKPSPQQQNTTCYTTAQLNEMVGALRKFELQGAENVTLAVRAVYAARCVSQLQTMLTKDLPNATLTVWNSDGDDAYVSNEGLRELLDKVKKNRIYLDLPQSMRDDVLNHTSKSSSNRVGSIIALIVLPLTVALCRLQ